MWLQALLDRCRKAWQGRSATRRDTESDVSDDPGHAGRRDAGGRATATAADQQGTTGPGRNATFVGRAAGQDLGYAGTTGAEQRAGASSAQPGSPDARPPETPEDTAQHDHD